MIAFEGIRRSRCSSESGTFLPFTAKAVLCVWGGAALGKAVDEETGTDRDAPRLGNPPPPYEAKGGLSPTSSIL